MTTDVEIPKSTVDVHSNLEISLAPLSLPSGVGIFPGVSLWSSRAEPKTPEPLCIEDHVFTLRCKVQNYAWGKKGLESTVAQLQSFTEDITRKLDLPFAELWMGTHSSGPSWIQTRSGSRQLFSEHLMQNTNSLGPRFLDRFNIELGLPFLFKVLSVETALSIQAHPDKKLAEKLHTRFPDVYKDDNHKPELACALTHFEALCEFRPVIEIAGFLSSVSEFRSVIGEEAASRFENFVASPDVEDIKLRKAALKKLYARLMSCAADDVKACLLRMVNRLNGLGDEQSEFDKLLLRVYGQYPGDIGVFSLFFLNYVTLQPGEALYLGPNLPHAYLSGDCVEIMATSDNVVRAGLFAFCFVAVKVKVDECVPPTPFTPPQKCLELIILEH